MEVLAPAVKRALGWPAPMTATFAELCGVEHLQRIAVVDQSPIGRSPRATPATTLGVLEPLRQAFAQSPESKARGFTAARFGFNAKAGQCPACKGLGAVRMDLAVLGEEFAVCESCNGARFNAATLAVRYRGLSIADALSLSVEQALEFFANHPKIAGPLAAAASVGLGYLRLDQWATRISGGEAQRLKLAETLAKDHVERTLFVLDEPTAGLHFADVRALLGLLRRLVGAGHTVVAVEHHLDFIRAADWAVDLGPEGGAGGGQVLAATTPAELARLPTATGRALAAVW
jgi:excinuclease ABC subunit A